MVYTHSRNGLRGAPFAAGIATLLLANAPQGARAQDIGGAQSVQSPRVTVTHTIRGFVTDSATGQPLPGAQVQLRQRGLVEQVATTGPLGRFALTDVRAGAAVVEIRRVGFRPHSIALAGTEGQTTLTIRLSATTTVLDAMAVSAARSPAPLDARSGNQLFQPDSYRGSPATSTTGIVQQSIAGAARAPTGEVHIRGQHGEFTYYVDGMPVQPGISGSLSELFAPDVVDRIEFQTGGWDAEYGNRNTAVIKVDTKIPIGGLRLIASANAGSFNTFGQSLMASTNLGRLGVLASLTQQATDLRREPVMQNTGTGAPENFENHGLDRYGFVKLRYAMSRIDLLTLNAGLSRAAFEVPFDSTGGFRLDDRQQEANGFVNASWRRAIASGAGDGELFVGLSHRASELRYTPGITDQPIFQFFPDTARYLVREHRSASTNGVKADLTLPSWRRLQFKTGAEATFVQGTEDFATTARNASAGPAVLANVRGSDIGGYVQASVRLASWFEVRPGIRVDAHTAPLSGTTHQISPRLRLNFQPTALTTAWLYYGRQFVPSPVEDFKVLAEAGQSGMSGSPTLPERDHFFEAGSVQRVRTLGLSIKLVGYHKRSGPAIDDNTLPGTSLTATVNVATVRVTGVESVIDVRPDGPLSGSLNLALAHAYAHGPITGGFSPTVFPTGYYDLDHDQRLSATASLLYHRPRWFVSAVATAGSGLTNGNPSATENRVGLFDFNRGVKVAPSVIVNASGGVTMRAGSATVRAQLFVDNALDRRYVLKGAFTSGASIGRPRTFNVKVSVAH